MENLGLCGISATDPVIVCAYSDTNKYGSSVEDVRRSRDRSHPWQMQEDVRRILKVAAPFAGVALGWYLFLPNFRYMQLSGANTGPSFCSISERWRSSSDPSTTDLQRLRLKEIG